MVFIKKIFTFLSTPSCILLSLLSSEWKRRARRKAAVVCMNQQFVSAAHSSSFQLILAYGINYKHFACLSWDRNKDLWDWRLQFNLIPNVVILNNSTSTHTDVAIKKQKNFHFSTNVWKCEEFPKINVMCSSYVVKKILMRK